MLVAKSTTSYQLYLEHKVERTTYYGTFTITSTSNVPLTDTLKDNFSHQR